METCGAAEESIIWREDKHDDKTAAGISSNLLFQRTVD